MTKETRRTRLPGLILNRRLPWQLRPNSSEFDSNCIRVDEDAFRCPAMAVSSTPSPRLPVEPRRGIDPYSVPH